MQQLLPGKAKASLEYLLLEKGAGMGEMCIVLLIDLSSIYLLFMSLMISIYLLILEC